MATTFRRQRDFAERLREVKGMAAPTSAKHVLFDDKTVKWVWSLEELMLFRNMWNKGLHIQTIATALKTNKRSIALLVMDQAENKKIKQRKTGLFGKDA